MPRSRQDNQEMIRGVNRLPSTSVDEVDGHRLRSRLKPCSVQVDEVDEVDEKGIKFSIRIAFHINCEVD